MKTYNRFIYTICLIMFFGFVFSQQVPGKEQSKSILISNGILHVGNGELLENAFVGFENGKINYVSNKQPDKDYQINIDATNKHIYPGFIALNTSLGPVSYTHLTLPTTPYV